METSVTRQAPWWKTVASVAASVAGIAVLAFVVIVAITMTSVTNPSSGRSDAARARASLASLRIAYATANEYFANHSVWPATVEELPEDSMESAAMTDGWGNPLVYTPNPPGSTTPFRLYSCGPDGAANTADDISIPWP